MNLNRELQMRTTLSKSDIGWADSNQGKANSYGRNNKNALGPSDRAFIANGLHP